MKKKEHIELTGTVVEAHGNGLFTVQLHINNVHVLGYLSGKLRINLIRILEGDEVLIELSPYDLTRGRITYRLPRKKDNSTSETNNHSDKN